MKTGFYIRNGYIYGSQSEDTKSYVEDGEIIVGKRSSGYWIDDDGHIVDQAGGSTGFVVDDDEIFGPGQYLPWL